jgi:hypothetical protein
MAIPNPDEIYHKASSGRLQNTIDSKESYDDVHFISMHVEGSEEDKREKQRWLKNESVRLNDNVFVQIVLCAVATASFAIADFLYGIYLPVINYFLKAAVLIFIIILIHYIVRQVKISRESRKLKKRNIDKK